MGNFHKNAVRILYKMYDISCTYLLFLRIFEWCKTLEGIGWMDQQMREELGYPNNNTSD
jgi:hypothetical protein